MNDQTNDVSGAVERLRLFLRLWGTDTAGVLMKSAVRDQLGHDLVVYAIDLLDPIGYAVAHGLQRCGIESEAALEHLIRSAFASTPSSRPILWGVASAAALADIMDRIGSQPKDLVEQIRKPAHVAHVRALFVAGLGAELVQVPAAECDRSSAPDIH